MSSSTDTRLLALPDEILRNIATRLDQESLFAFARAHPRLRDVCQELVSLERIKSVLVDSLVVHYVSSEPMRVRSLNLSNCWSSSEAMRRLIRQCRMLSELHVINSSLSVAHLLDVLGELQSLKELSATVAGAGIKTRTGRYPSVEKIYLEFPPNYVDAKFVIELSKACLNVRHLRANVIGNPASKVPPARNALFSALDLNSYETVLISTGTHCRWTCEDAVYLLFRAQAGRGEDRICWHDWENVPRPGTARVVRLGDHFREISYQPIRNGRDDRNVLEMPNFNTRGEQIIGARVKVSAYYANIRLARLDELSSVVELDFSHCHSLYSAPALRSLANLSPALEALALPPCSLSASEQPENRSSTEGELIKAIASMQLKKLHVTRASRGCQGCRQEVPETFLEHLSNSKTLKELSLHDVPLSRRFFTRVDGPLPMCTIKLSVEHVHDENELLGFLSQCKNLRNLKLEALDLPLSLGMLWYALGNRSLKRLCLSSAAAGSTIDPAILRLNLAWLFRTLDVFHLHARNIENAEEIGSLIEEEVRRVNLGRGQNPIRVLIEKPSAADDSSFQDVKMVGRSFCYMDSFIGIPKPVGWDVEL